MRSVLTSARRSPYDSVTSAFTARLARRRALRDVEEHVLDRAVAAAGAQLLDRAARDEPAAVDHQHPVAHRRGVLDHVRADEDRVSGRAQVGEDRAQLALAERVEPDHRLVEQQHRRAAEHGRGEQRLLAHPFRERAAQRVAFGRHREPREQRIGARFPARAAAS